MWSKKYWLDVAERAIKTGAQAVLLGLGLGEGFNAFNVDWMIALGFALGGAFLSFLTSLISAPFGDPDSASLLSDK